MALLDVLFYLHLVICILAILFNSLLIHLVFRYTENSLGFYKWLVIFYSIFESTYAFVILLGMPVHVVAYGQWMALNYGGILGGTSWSYFGPALYCSFYEMWLGFLAIQFIYRYVVVCLPDLSLKVERSSVAKALIGFLCLLFIGLTLICGFVLCTRQKLTETSKLKVEDEFSLDSVHHSEYILLRTTDSEGNPSVFGLVTIVNHHLLVISSSLIMFFCSYHIHQAITKLRTFGTSLRRIKLQRQLFVSLLLQTLVPVIFCHIPSIVFLSFPFLKTSFSFGSFSLLFTFLTSIEKVIDPIIVIFCISDCRRAVKSHLNLALLNSAQEQEETNE